MIVFDVETDNKANLILIGVIRNGKYRYFTNATKFWQWVKQNNIREVFCHNLEYDFFKIYEYLPDLRFCGYYSKAGLSYVQVGNVFFKDTYNHLAYTLKHIGHLLGIEKLEPEYDKITKLTPYLIKCNKNHCLITWRTVQLLHRIYTAEGSKRIKSTVGSQALEIYTKRFKCCNLLTLDKKTVLEWRSGYKGGWCECFKKGEFTDTTYYYIDVNSLYPFVMRFGYPYPYKFKIVKKLSDKLRYSRYWLGVTDDGVINSVEHRHEQAKYYYVFMYTVYPFRKYIDYFYDKKKQATGLEREIYKKLQNSLYGKFGQHGELDVVSNYKYQKQDNVCYMEQIVGDLYRIKFDAGSKFWVNVVWSLFTTARARYYMLNMKKYVERKGLTAYYTDTDSFILSGDLKNIQTIISDTKLGLFKLEHEAESVDIRGKKFYRFGDSYRCKGVPAAYRKKFFTDGKVTYPKMVRYKEALLRGLRVGQIIPFSKSNVKNRS